MRIFFFSNFFWRFFEFIFVLIRIKFVEEEKHDNHSIFDKDFIKNELSFLIFFCDFSKKLVWHSAVLAAACAI